VFLGLIPETGANEPADLHNFLKMHRDAFEKKMLMTRIFRDQVIDKQSQLQPLLDL